MDEGGRYVEEPKGSERVVDWAALAPKVADFAGIVGFVAVALGIGYAVGDYVVPLLVGILYALLARL